MVRMNENRTITMDVEKLAEGVYGLFTEEEKDILRFGMLPAKKMELVEKDFRRKFLESSYELEDVGDDRKEESHFSYDSEGEMVVFNMNRLVSEAMHKLTVELYRIGNLVV